MGGMIPSALPGTAPAEAPVEVAPPLAEVACCREIVPTRASLEPSLEPRLHVGDVLDGAYLIRELISRGGMGTVYRASDLRQGGRDVAIKVPLRRVECDAAGFARFRHEEEVGLMFSHPGLLKFHEVTGKKSRTYLVMEFLPGCTLAGLEPDLRPLAEADALKIVALVCEAVAHMHARGIVHRDLSPSNILIGCDRTLRVMDFGLAAPPLHQRSVMAKLTTIMGAPEYMAPEQVENGAIDERADIYAVGAILYELLTGSVPFRHHDPWESAYQRTRGDPIAPRALSPALSPQAEEIVLHALQRNPSDRYPSMAAFQAELTAPGRVAVTGYCDRLRPPRWKLGFQATPILAGMLLGIGALGLLVALFLVLCAHPLTR